MININATVRWKGYSPDDLSSHSHKRVWVNCDACGCGRWVSKSQVHALCFDCSIHTKEYKKKHTKSNNTDRIKKTRSDNATIQWSDVGIRSKMLDGINQAWDVTRKKNARECSLGDKSYWFGKFGEDSANWRGGKHRSNVLPVNQCIKLNDKFAGSDAHHITSSIVIYIPEELHHHFNSHCLETGLNMAEVNMAALQYINGCYDG